MATGKQLIYADACPCKDCLKNLHECDSRICNEFAKWMLTRVDAVEVVRCKDCKHRIYVDMGDDIGAVGGCELFGMAMSYNNFCSYGERKDND